MGVHIFACLFWFVKILSFEQEEVELFLHPFSKNDGDYDQSTTAGLPTFAKASRYKRLDPWLTFSVNSTVEFAPVFICICG